MLTHAYEWVPLIPPKVWINVHHVNKTDDIHSSAQSRSHRFMDLACQIKSIMMNAADIRLMILILIALQQLFLKDLMVSCGLTQLTVNLIEACIVKSITILF